MRENILQTNFGEQYKVLQGVGAHIPVLGTPFFRRKWFHPQRIRALSLKRKFFSLLCGIIPIELPISPIASSGNSPAVYLAAK